MPDAAFLSLLGLFTRKEFLDADLCARLRAEVRSSTSKSAEVHDGEAVVLDERIRRTKRVLVPDPTAMLVEQQLLRLQTAFESHFNLQLSGCQKPQFLTYRLGDFFSKHDDGGVSADPAIRERRVSVVIFLNGESDVPREDSYGGGALTFYGLLQDPRLKRVGVPLVGEAGLLVAFRSGVYHSVTPVTHGERHTIVTWFH